MGEIIQVISVLLEVIIALMGILIAVKNKKLYGWGIFFTFAVYVIYDYVGLTGLSFPEIFLYILFLLATVSMFMVVLTLYKKGGKKK